MSHAATLDRPADAATAQGMPPAPGGAGTGALAGAPREVLSFKLGAEEYGIDILKVQEIRGYESPTRIANVPAFMKGVVNLRGVIVPVVDMRLRFDLPGVSYDAFTVVIILNLAGRTIGMVVDSVSDVLALGPDQIKPAPDFNGQIEGSHIIGLGAVKTGEVERMMILMDIEGLMASEGMGLRELVF